MKLREQYARTKARSRVLDLLTEEFDRLQEDWEAHESKQYREGVSVGRVRDLSAQHIRYLRTALARAKQRAIEELEMSEGDVADILLAFGYDDRELARLEGLAAEQGGTDDERALTQYERWLEEGLADLQQNVLWVLYGQQAALDSGAPTYALYSLYIAVRAVVRLMTHVPNGRELLVDLLGDEQVPPQDLVDEFAAVARDFRDPFRYLQSALFHVPNVAQAASKLLRQYEAAVDWVAETPHAQLSQAFANVFLPPDPRVPLEYGVMLYASQRYSIARIMQMTKLSRRQLVDELRRRGLMRYPGRPATSLEPAKEVPYRDDLRVPGDPGH